MIALGVILTVHSLIVRQGTRPAFDKRKGVLAEVKTVVVVSDEVSETRDVDLISSTGLYVKGRLRIPRTIRPPYAGVILLGGLKRGRNVVNFPGLDEFLNRGLVASIDYPLDTTKKFNVADLPRIHRSAFEAVASILLMVDYLERRTDVDRQRIVLIGVSFGSPFAIITGGLDERVKAVASLYGAGELGPIFSYLIEREKPFKDSFWGPTAAYVLGRAGALLLAPLEPTRYVSMISPRPVLFINGAEDESLPRSSVEALYTRASEPRKMIWLKSGHIRPTKQELLQQMSQQTIQWLIAQGML